MARSPTVVQIAVPLSAGLGLWLLVCLIGGTSEPWDAPGYWTVAYPASIALSGVLGFGCDRRGWLAGLMVTLAQFPVMLVLAGAGPMSVAGLILLGALAVPAAALSAATSRIGRTLRRRRQSPEA